MRFHVLEIITRIDQRAAHHLSRNVGVVFKCEVLLCQRDPAVRKTQQIKCFHGKKKINQFTQLLHC